MTKNNSSYANVGGDNDANEKDEKYVDNACRKHKSQGKQQE